MTNPKKDNAAEEKEQEVVAQEEIQQEELKSETSEESPKEETLVEESPQEEKAETQEEIKSEEVSVQEAVEQIKPTEAESTSTQTSVEETAPEVAEPVKEVEKVETIQVAQTEDLSPAQELLQRAAEEEEARKNEDPADFDWDLGKRSVKVYEDEEFKKLEKIYDDTLQTVSENEIVSGIVVGITNADVVLNIGFKSDGLVSLSEFRDIEDLKIGDEVDVYVVDKEDFRGQLVLSRKNAKLLRAWEEIVNSYENDKILNGTITSKTKGGLIVNVLGLETFLPGSQIDVKPIIDYDSYVGKKMEFKVVKVNETIKNAVVSHKALIESDLESQRQDIISKLDEGQVLEGIVKNITDFGAFIDLGGVDGLLYITDISWGRINHPSDVLELNQSINVVVLSFDNEKKRISLGLKQLESHPWDVLDEKLDVGSKVKGKVVNIEDYGAFLEITPGVEGLIHVSEVSWSNQPINSKDYFKQSDSHEAIVMTIDREERKMSLSVKRLMPDPWEKIKDKFSDGTKHTGLVQNLTPYGVFVELEEGIGGMVHISDLSWTRRYSHPSEFTSVGADLEVIVLAVDLEDRKLTLGHKQLEEDPWDTFESVFPVGSVHEGTVIKREDNGGIVQLQYGLEGFAPNRHLKKDDGQFVVLDETLNFKVIEFDRKDKKIILSHTKYLEDLNRVEGGETASPKKAGAKKTTKGGAKTTNRKMEKTTLGDIQELANLKENLEKAEQGGAPEVEAKPKAKAKKAEQEVVEAKEEKVEEKAIEKKEEKTEDSKEETSEEKK